MRYWYVVCVGKEVRLAAKMHTTPEEAMIETFEKEQEGMYYRTSFKCEALRAAANPVDSSWRVLQRR
jgi:hypothetical protein